MSKCKFCGLEIQWADRFGERVPLDPNFKDHREKCAGMANIQREDVRDRNHESLVKAFLRGSMPPEKKKHKRFKKRSKRASPDQIKAGKAFKIGQNMPPLVGKAPWEE